MMMGMVEGLFVCFLGGKILLFHESDGFANEIGHLLGVMGC